VRLLKASLGRDPESAFVVPEIVATHLGAARTRGAEQERAWREKVEQKLDRDLGFFTSWQEAAEGILPSGWDDQLPAFTPAEGPMATRKASGIVLNTLAARLPFLLGGSADLAPSNNTELKGQDAFHPGGSGRNIHFGVREHAMGAILNGLAHTPGLRPFGGTFLIFADYMRPPMRLAAMMGIAPVYVFTHDSVGLGEDGPTHQPVEQLPGLRAVPDLTVIRPGDANETAAAWRLAIANRTGPTALLLSRQNLPILDRGKFAAATGMRRGGYVLAREEGSLAAILIASGSELHPAVEARELLQREGVGTRVVSLPCWELFEVQDPDYRAEVLPADCTVRVAVEAAAPLGWERYVGTAGAVVAMPGFGASAPGGQLLKHFGFTAENIAVRVRALLTAQS
jgi:transketolase